MNNVDSSPISGVGGADVEGTGGVAAGPESSSPPSSSGGEYWTPVSCPNRTVCFRFFAVLDRIDT